VEHQRGNQEGDMKYKVLLGSLCLAMGSTALSVQDSVAADQSRELEEVIVSANRR
jgi:hypothetical protein